MEWELIGILILGLYALIGVLFRFPQGFPNFSNVNERDDRLDQIRGLAMIGIVTIHVHSYFTFFHAGDDSITRWTLFISNLSRFAVPVFIFGSSLHLKIKEGYWFSKTKSLIMPYFLASVFGYLIKYPSYSAFDFGLRFLTGQVFAPYYFVPLLIQIYFLFYILPESLKKGKGLLLFTFVCFTLNFLSNIDILTLILPLWYLPISIFNYLAFFSVGLIIRQHKTNSRIFSFHEILTMLILLFIFIFLILTYSFKGVEFKNHHLIYPLLTIFLLNEFLPKKASTYFHKFLSFVGKNSLFIFLIHPFVIHQMHAWDPLSFGLSVFAYVLTLAVNLIIPCGVAYLFTYRKGKILNR